MEQLNRKGYKDITEKIEALMKEFVDKVHELVPGKVKEETDSGLGVICAVVDLHNGIIDTACTGQGIAMLAACGEMMASFAESTGMGLAEAEDMFRHMFVSAQLRRFLERAKDPKATFKDIFNIKDHKMS